MLHDSQVPSSAADENVIVQVHLTHTSLYNINIQVYIHKLTNSETKGTEHVILWPLLRDKRNRTCNAMAPAGALIFLVLQLTVHLNHYGNSNLKKYTFREI